MKETFKQILWCLSLGFEIVFSFMICIYIGLKLDSYFSSKPVCVLIGIVFAFISVIMRLLGVMRNG